MYGASKDSLYLILCDIAVFGNPVYGFGPEAEVARIKMGVFPYVCGHTGHVRCQPAVLMPHLLTGKKEREEEK